MMSDLRAGLYNGVVRVLSPRLAAALLPGLRRQLSEVGVTVAPAAQTRLLIGAANSAGQGYEWARAVSARVPNAEARSMMFSGDDDVFSFSADHVVPATALVGNDRWRRAQRRAILTGFTHVIIESATHLWEPRGDVLAAVRELQQSGVRVALLWHGSDIRLPSAHRAREPDSPFTDAYASTEVLEGIARRHRLLIEEAGVPNFVSTPDLLTDVPSAIWVPLVADPQRWTTEKTLLSSDRPVVVHVPTRAALKGSAAVIPVLERLHDEGLIRYRHTGPVAANQMTELYRTADIVLDQFSIGSYGVTAVEALAAGRLVVGHVSEAVRRLVKEKSGLELPIVESRATEIEDSLRTILADRARFARVGALGPAFAQSLHDGRASAAALSSFLSS